MKTNFKQQIQKVGNENVSFSQKLVKNKQTPFKIGDILTVKIHSLGPNQYGFSELQNGYTIAVPKVSLGEELRVSIEKIFSGKTKYAIAKIYEKSNVKTATGALPVQVGQVMDVTISKTGPKGSGFVELGDGYVVVVPKAKVGDQIKIQMTRVKKEYAFGKIHDLMKEKKNKKTLSASQMSLKSTSIRSEDLSSALMQNSKFHLVLPKTSKYYRGYMPVKLNGFVVFIKMSLGAKPGDTVRIQTMKVGPNYAVAKILKVSPLNKAQKLLRAKNHVQEMVQTGMHFGEKAIRCHANMRKYVWYRKKGKNSNRLQSGSLNGTHVLSGNRSSLVSRREDVKGPLLKKDRYYINLLRTRRCLKNALKQLAKYAAKGKTFLFVGTKKSAAALVARTALFTKTSFFVNTRWLGGMLTNWKTILKSISQIKPILKEKQKMIQNILEKRQKMKQRFIKKVNLLRKRSQKLMAKGKLLIEKMKKNRNLFIQKSQQLLQKKQQILVKNQVFIQKYIELKNKKQELKQQVQGLSQQKMLLAYQKQNLIKKLKANQTKLKEFKQLFLIGQEFAKLKKHAKDNGQTVLSVSYEKFYAFSNSDGLNAQWVVPNPPKDILNRMLQSMKMKYEPIYKIESKTAQNVSQNHAKSESSLPTGDSLIEQQEKNSKNTILFSKLFHKFTSFLPFIKVYMENLVLRIQTLQMFLKNQIQNMTTVNQTLVSLKEFSQRVSSQIEKVKTKLLSQQKVLKLLKAKLKRLASEQRLLKFLPRLRYLPTPKNKMAETVQILMKKFVDPKMVIPMEQIYDEKFQFTSKKIAAARKQKWQRLEKYFGGITKMAKMSKKQISNNIAIIIGQQEEMNAVRECEKLGIKMFTLVDTNCNPRLSNHIIPANDDSRNSVKYILQEMLTHIRLAQKLRQKVFLRKIRR